MGMADLKYLAVQDDVYRARVLIDQAPISPIERLVLHGSCDIMAERHYHTYQEDTRNDQFSEGAGRSGTRQARGSSRRHGR